MSAVFSRTGNTSPLGKRDAMVDGFRVESVAKEAFERKVASTGKPRAEFLRNVVHIVAFGLEEATRMHGEGVVVVWKTISGMSNDT